MGADPFTLALGATAGASLLGAQSQSDAAKDAARAQKGAADQAAQVQREALQQMRLATEPFRFGAQQSINPLLQSLGIGSVQLPNQPVFNLFTGQQAQTQDPHARLAELRALKAQLEG